MQGMKISSWLAALVALSFAGRCASAGTSPLYENRGIADSPVVDATVFLNRGTFNVASGSQPYDTQGTLYYTNFAGALITGSGGFAFEYVGTNGFRRAASSFVNQGTISLGASDGGLILPGLGIGGGGAVGFTSSSWITVQATNIFNRGGLTVGSEGLISLTATNTNRTGIVNLSRSGLRAGTDPFAPIRQGSVRGLTYSNDEGVTDLYWGVGQNNELDPAAAGPFDLAVLTGNVPSSGFHQVLVGAGVTNVVRVSGTNTFAVTNALSPTNWVIQAVYVITNSTDPDFKVDVKWGTPRIGNLPGAKMPIVRWTFQDIDTITTEPYTNYVYLLDSHGALTNSVLTTNTASRFGSTNTTPSQRPSNFIVTRVTPPEWSGATTSSIPYTKDLIYNSTYDSQTVTNWYSGYSAQIGTASSGSSSSSGFFGRGIPELSHPTNLPGRIEIDADKLDLSLARFRSEGLLSVRAKEMTGQAPYKLDSTVVSMDVGVPAGSLVVSNLIQPIVRRFNGTVSAWSGIWTNLTSMVGPDPNDPTLQATNVVEIRFHALVVQHNFITRVPVETYRFSAQAPQLVLRDSINVQENLSIDVPEVDLAASVNTLANPITPDTFSGLVRLTNRVALTTQGSFQLGIATNPVQTLVNTGRLSGSILQLYTDSLENSGQVSTTVGDLTLTTRNLKLEQGTIASVANAFIQADDFKAQGSKVSAGYQARNQTSGNTNYYLGKLTLDVATRLTDGGPTASNVWTVYDGVRLVRRPAEGDLLGTKLVSKVGRFAEAVHEWAGEDRGATAAGFTNNAALGELVLDGLAYSLYTFRSATTNATALYVDRLVLTNAVVDAQSSLNIEPGFTLYFADSNVDPQTLDGLFDGRLRWVKDQAGTGSGAAVTLASGHVVWVNRALLASPTIDTDGDGTPNALDAAPLEPSALRIAVRLVPGPSNQAEISWTGMPGSRYRVEYVSGVNGAGWQTLSVVEHAQDVPGELKVTDQIDAPAEPRFYRVVADR